MTDLEKAARMALKTLEYIDLRDNDRDFLSYKECHNLYEAITVLRQALSDSVEQPAQQSAERVEPVAWINWSALTGQRRLGWECESEIASEPLYTRPQAREWVGLTDEEFEVVLPYCHNEFDLQEYKDFARAIEAKLKDKNIK
jgi:hypothetical protein